MKTKFNNTSGNYKNKREKAHKVLNSKQNKTQDFQHREMKNYQDKERLRFIYSLVRIPKRRKKERNSIVKSNTSEKVNVYHGLEIIHLFSWLYL